MEGDGMKRKRLLVAYAGPVKGLLLWLRFWAIASRGQGRPQRRRKGA